MTGQDISGARPPSGYADRRLSIIASALLAAAPSVAASVLGSLATMPNIPSWYAALDKPWFNPPNWIFGPVWTALYIMVAYAFFRILRLPAGAKGRTAAIIVFVVQMALNTAWSFAFFGANSPALGLAVITPLWAGIALSIALFWRLDRKAALLLTPYLAWVSFATILNVAIWRLNG
ncbi:MAG: TspO/MBR family protein [Beijerinckiaceae bacterium]|nr:TspO/MBR family protein [Beijerinckiaceae bacterium]